jgi:hypothetical protein
MAAEIGDRLDTRSGGRARLRGVPRAGPRWAMRYLRRAPGEAPPRPLAPDRRQLVDGCWRSWTPTRRRRALHAALVQFVERASDEALAARLAAATTGGDWGYHAGSVAPTVAPGGGAASGGIELVGGEHPRRWPASRHPACEPPGLRRCQRAKRCLARRALRSVYAIVCGGGAEVCPARPSRVVSPAQDPAEPELRFEKR